MSVGTYLVNGGWARSVERDAQVWDKDSELGMREDLSLGRLAYFGSMLFLCLLESGYWVRTLHAELEDILLGAR